MNKTILIVDDEPEVLQAVSRLVKNLGYEVLAANNGEEALNILAGNTVDLVLTDLMMPGITGWQLLDEIKKQQPETMVVLFTGYIDQQGEAMLVDRKADGFLVKPIDLKKVRTLLASLLKTEAILGSEIIAVDDELTAQKLIKTILTKAGCQVRIYASAVRALAAAEATPPDLFVIDLEMPKVDGFELCARIRDLKVLSNVPIVILTGHSDRDTVTRALDLGIQGFIVKPYSREALVEKVKKALAQTVTEGG